MKATNSEKITDKKEGESDKAKLQVNDEAAEANQEGLFYYSANEQAYRIFDPD